MPLVFAFFRSFFLSLFSTRDLILENLALRQQLAMYKHKLGKPRARPSSKLFWVALSRLWSGWKRCLCIVEPATIVRWHNQAFAQFWCWKSGISPGRPPTTAWLRSYIIAMARNNTGWGAQRIYDELEKQSLHAGLSTIAAILSKAGFDPWPGRNDRRQRWCVFRAIVTTHSGAS